MPKIVVTHQVADIDTWLTHKAERAAAIGTLGGTNVVDHVIQDGTNTIAISAQTDDLDGLMAALGSPSPELEAVMKEHGVIPPLSVFIER